MHANATSKETVILKLLEEGDTMVCLDARYEGVAMPREHADNPALRLIFNLNFPQPIDVTTEGIHANLAFGGRRHACYIPMDAVWAAFNPQTMQGMMWQESMPEEVRTELAINQQQDATTPPVSEPSQTPAAPRVVAGSKKETPSEQDTTPKKPRQRGHLRVVK
jgi:stringent starvation protein B